MVSVQHASIEFYTIAQVIPMSRIERKYCSISTSYLVGLSDIFILLSSYLTEFGVFWCLFTNEDTL